MAPPLLYVLSGVGGMRVLFPSRAPFIPTKHISPLPEASFFPHEIAHLPPENEKIFTRCKYLVYGEMNATQRVLLRNIFR